LNSQTYSTEMRYSMKIHAKLLPYQAQAITAPNRVVCLAMGVGSGKTATVVLAAITSMLQGCRVLVIEPTVAQLRDPFMREVEKQLVRYGIAQPGQKLWNQNTKEMNLMGGQILGRSAEQGSAAFAGIDGIDVLIIDEADKIEDQKIFLEGKNRQRKTKFPDRKKVYLVGNGTFGEHWFKDEAMKPENLLINACYRDNYFLDQQDIDDYDAAYGENTIYPKSYVDAIAYGKFVSECNDSMFPEMKWDAPPQPGVKVAGYDVAYSGTGDDSCIVFLDGNILRAIECRKTHLHEELIRFQNEFNLRWKPDFWNYDSTGNAVKLSGTGLSFGAAGGSFANLKTKIYFDLKRKLQAGLHVPQEIKQSENFYKLKQELNATKLNLEKESRKPRICEKADIKKIIRRSPDRADALALAAADRGVEIDYSKQRRLEIENNPFRGW